jgi:hypothetical protein
VIDLEAYLEPRRQRVEAALDARFPLDPAIRIG